MKSNLKTMIRELVRKELEEMTSSGAAGAYLTPNAFGGPPDKKTTEVLGMKEVGSEKKEDTEDKTTVKEAEHIPILKWKPVNGDLVAKHKGYGFSIYDIGASYVLQVNGKNRIKGTITVCKAAAEDIVHGTLKEDEALPVQRRHLAKLTEGRIVEYEDMTPRQKIYQLSREAKRSVNEIELLLDKMLAIKETDGVNSDDYYKRTHKALQTMNEKIKHCILKMNSMK
jgi:hypothetical protein